MFNETTYGLGDLGYTYNELVSLAQGAGCSPESAQKAAAIAMAESSGNPQAYNPAGRDDSYGLWQINMKGALGPARRSQFGLSSNQQLYDPATNARAMVAISGGCQSFSPWSTFTSGAYRKFLQAIGLAPSTPAPASGSGIDIGTLTPSLSGGIPLLVLAGVGLVAAWFLLK